MTQAANGNLSVFILAGGKSTRMGRDKAFVEFEGRTLLARALELARSVTPSVRIIGSREKFSAYAPVIEDIFHDCGPLAGIHAALLSSQEQDSTELNLMLAVDMPFVTRALLQYVAAAAGGSPKALAVVPRSGDRLQPLCAIYRPDFGAEAEKFLRTGKNKINPLFNVVPSRILEEEELQLAGFSPSLFRNLNTPEELSCAREQSGLSL
jgi:molybdopterin-guanine dinucleotide biosynthesis protein A